MEAQVFGGEHHSGRPARQLWNAMWNGVRGKCPKCGQGKLFSSFLKIVPACEHCGEEMHHHRADDFPAYIVVVIVGHVVLGGFMAFEAAGILEINARAGTADKNGESQEAVKRSASDRPTVGP